MIPCRKTHCGSTLPFRDVAPQCGGDFTSWDWCDNIGLRDLLGASAVDLDELRPHTLHTAPLRYWGLALDLTISYTNLDRADFWFLSPRARLKPKYTIKAIQHALEEAKAQVYIMTTGDGHNDTRQVVTR